MTTTQNKFQTLSEALLSEAVAGIVPITLGENMENATVETTTTQAQLGPMEQLIKKIKIVGKSQYKVRVIVNGRNIGIERKLVTVTRSGEITHAIELIVDAHFKENSIEALHRVIAKQNYLIDLTKTDPSAFDDIEDAVRRANKKIEYFEKAIKNNGIFN
jgi:hypothetical protein